MLKGTKRLKSDIELMLKSKLNFYWKICFRFFTPILVIVISFTQVFYILTFLINFCFINKIVCFITIVSNSEVVLGDYKYPLFAHIIGWSLVAIILSPLLKHAIMATINSGVMKVNPERNSIE